MLFNLVDFVQANGNLANIHAREKTQDTDLHIVASCFATTTDPIAVLEACQEVIKTNINVDKKNAAGKTSIEIVDRASLKPDAQQQYDIFCQQLIALKASCNKYQTILQTFPQSLEKNNTTRNLNSFWYRHKVKDPTLAALRTQLANNLQRDVRELPTTASYQSCQGFFKTLEQAKSDNHSHYREHRRQGINRRGGLAKLLEAPEWDLALPF